MLTKSTRRQALVGSSIGQTSPGRWQDLLGQLFLAAGLALAALVGSRIGLANLLVPDKS